MSELVAETCTWCRRGFTYDPKDFRPYQHPVNVPVVDQLKASEEGLPPPDNDGVLCDTCCLVNATCINAKAKAKA